MPTLVGTSTQLQLQSNNNLLDGIQDSTSPGHTGHNEAPKTQDEYNSVSQQSDSQRNPEPMQGITTAMTTELPKVTSSAVQGKIFYLKAMLPNYAGKEEPDPLMVYKETSDPDTMYINQAMKKPDSQDFCKETKKDWKDS